MVRAIDKGIEELKFGMLWLIVYLFLLRLPSEVTVSCLPCCPVAPTRVAGFADMQRQS